MRIAGSVLLFFGLLLCASIDWAAVGFVTMGAGLLCFQAAENKKETIALQGGQPSIELPLSQRVNRERSTNFDRERWRSLAESDRDIAQAEAILARCGAKYAEQFSRTYLIFENKALLPNILGTIVASYRIDSGLDSNVGARTIANFSIGAQASPTIPDRPQTRMTPADGSTSPDLTVEERPSHKAQALSTPEQLTTPDDVQIGNDATELDTTSPADNDSTQNLKQLLEWLDRPAAQK